MQQRGIDPTERLEVGRLLAHALPLFIVTIMALLTFLRANEDLFDFGHPVSLGLAIGLLGDGPFVERDRQYGQDQ